MKVENSGARSGVAIIARTKGFATRGALLACEAEVTRVYRTARLCFCQRSIPYHVFLGEAYPQTQSQWSTEL
jgi:hypothetical protein